eukprot:TRINITY_DN80496_c0_g1_i1.p1 TRINITY_DN80496_c0_g1~~TRINITY_DN80496_c0_g1_i1.p1  ORF type:complete len:1023 (-),score=180.07 TRINITY_DN80496_c0_g1_i1:243-3311(-)
MHKRPASNLPALYSTKSGSGSHLGASCLGVLPSADGQICSADLKLRHGAGKDASRAAAEERCGNRGRSRPKCDTPPNVSRPLCSTPPYSPSSPSSGSRAGGEARVRTGAGGVGPPPGISVERSGRTTSPASPLSPMSPLSPLSPMSPASPVAAVGQRLLAGERRITDPSDNSGSLPSLADPDPGGRLAAEHCPGGFTSERSTAVPSPSPPACASRRSSERSEAERKSPQQRHPDNTLLSAARNVQLRRPPELAPLGLTDRQRPLSGAAGGREGSLQSRGQSLEQSLRRALSSGSLCDRGSESRSVSRAPESRTGTPPGIGSRNNSRAREGSEVTPKKRATDQRSLSRDFLGASDTLEGFSGSGKPVSGLLPSGMRPVRPGSPAGSAASTGRGESSSFHLPDTRMGPADCPFEVTSPKTPKPSKGPRPPGLHRLSDPTAAAAAAAATAAAAAGGPGEVERLADDRSMVPQMRATPGSSRQGSKDQEDSKELLGPGTPSSSASQGQGVRALQALQRLQMGRGSISKGASRGPRNELQRGSRDDSFLTTVSERSSESNSTCADSRASVGEAGQIEIFSEVGKKHDKAGVLTDFRQLHPELGEPMAQALRAEGWEKPLDTQRRVVPLVMSTFRDEQKSFVTVQGAPQCGKTSALALGLIGAMGTDPPGIRAVVLSTSIDEELEKYFCMASKVSPAVLETFDSACRKVTFEGVAPDPESAVVGSDPLEDLQRLDTAVSLGCPVVISGHPVRVLPLLREAPSLGIDLSGVQILALDDAEETVRMGLMDEVCEVCTILRHFAQQRLRHIVLSQTLSREAQSMIRCLRSSLVQQQNLFGIRAHRTQARARAVNHYYAVAPRTKWPAVLATLHHALSLPSGIIFDDASKEARAGARSALRGLGVQSSVWNALTEQGSGVHAAARDGAAAAKGPTFHIMPSDLMVLKVDVPQVRCVLHFEVPRRELSIYGLRLMCLEQDNKKGKSGSGKKRDAAGARSLSVLFVEDDEVVRELEKTFSIRMQEVPTDMLGRA